MSALSLSMEIELGWGQSLNPPEIRFKNLSNRWRTKETETLEKLLKMCDRHNVPITFDVVGHLFEESCAGEHLGPHEDTWFDVDPGTDQKTDPLFYAPDLIKQVTNAEVDHEIGTHTFSHVACDEISKETMEWELERTTQSHEEFGLDAPTSLVPPEHRHPPEDVLMGHGIETIRLRDGTYPAEGSLVERFAWHFTRDPPAFEPQQSNGITHVYTTHSPSLTAITLPSGRLKPHPSFQVLPKRVRERVHHQYLRDAIDSVRNGSHVHLWTHLYDLSNDHQWPLVRSFIEDVGAAQRDGEITVRTMDELHKLHESNTSTIQTND